MTLWHNDKLFSSDLFEFRWSIRSWTHSMKTHTHTVQWCFSWGSKIHHHTIDSFTLTAQSVVGVSVNLFPNTFQGKIESWIARPTHCRNIGPEGSSLVVILEVNGNDTEERISRKHRQEHSLGLYTESCFSALLCLLNSPVCCEM